MQVGDATNSQWRFGWAHWPDLGVWARDGSRTVRIACGISFGGWSPYRVVQLPGDQALLQLDRQICLLKLSERKIALIRHGYGMLAFHKDQIIERDGAVDGSQAIRLLTVPDSRAAPSRP